MRTLNNLECTKSTKDEDSQSSSAEAKIPMISGDSKDAATFILVKPPKEEGAGVLANLLNAIHKDGMSIHHMESRPSAHGDGAYEFMVELKGDLSHLPLALEVVEQQSSMLSVITDELSNAHLVNTEVPWFPRTIADLDQFATRVLTYGAELDADHPGFTDPVYRERRQHFADIAIAHKHGQPIPMIEYTREENETWAIVYGSLKQLFATHACSQFNNALPMLEQECGYSDQRVPQLRTVSDFLKGRTGFTIRPVAGYLSSRDFLAGLAFRVFHATQYIRHSSRPLYTPEPDVCHELIGHIALFADPEFAAFSQEIGLASLGTTDEFIEKLAACYFFTVEFGICRENGGLRVFGAGLLSSYDELEYCLSGKPELKQFDPQVAGVTKYPISEFQPVYFVTDTFEDAKQKIMAFATSNERPFKALYNAERESIEVVHYKKTNQNGEKEVY